MCVYLTFAPDLAAWIIGINRQRSAAAGSMAFSEIENLDHRHPPPRGRNYGAIRQHESRCHNSASAQTGQAEWRKQI